MVRKHNWEMPVEKSLSTYLVAFYVQTLLYGIYVVLFGMASYLLYKKRATVHWLLPATAAITFALATSDMGITHKHLFQDLLRGNDPVLRLKHIYVKVFLYVTSNIITDAFLIYRCYTVWGRQKRIIFLPGIFLITITALGYAFPVVVACPFREYAKIYLWLTFAINIIVTLLIASRVWSMTLERQRLLGTKQTHKCYYTIAVVIESGIVYSIFVLISVLIKSILLVDSLVQIAGIVPTAIIIQMLLGQPSRSVSKSLDNTTTPTAQPQMETPTPGDSIIEHERS